MKTHLNLRCFVLTLVGILLPALLWAQSGTITGLVTDNYGEPIIGANVVVKGTTNGVITDIDGKYILGNIKSGETVLYSYIGYVTQGIEYTNQPQIDIKLKESAISLDAVVVVGYEQKKKSVVTGAIGGINSDDLLQAKPANAVNALSGRVSGVNIISGSGQPGTSPKLIIRGVGTNGDSTPLYVIDGLQMDNMDNINPNDIESMEVLKDATSCAIYGARAANGVVLITTKKGTKGKTTISYNGYYGTNTVQKMPDMMNAQEYVMMINEFNANDGKTDRISETGVDTDWLDAIFNTAPVTEHNVTATLGSDKGTSLISLNYLDQNGIIGEDRSFFQRYTVRANNTYEFNKYFSVGANINYVNVNRQGISTGTNGWNPTTYAYNMEPITPIYDENNSDGYAQSVANFGRATNPLAFINGQGTGYNSTHVFYGNVYAELTVIDDLVFRTDFGANFRNNNSRSYQAEFFHSSELKNEKSSVSQNFGSYTNWQWENTMRYKKSFGDHNFSILAGLSANESFSVSMNGGRNNLPVEAEGNDNYWYINAGDVMTSTVGGTGSVRHAMFSSFGRLSYNYKERYLAEAVVRRDGSSNFGPQNKYAVFPGFSVGWNIANEEFWDVENFDSFKLRASWGQNGNERISAFSYTSIIGNSYNYTLGQSAAINIGSAPNSLINPMVRWETSEQLNIGADMTFFGGKLGAGFDLYDKRTKDLLFRPTLEAIRGNQSAYNNLGEISNKGVEMQVSYRESVGDVNFSVSGNVSYLDNEVIKIGNANGYQDGGKWRESTNVTRMEEGYAMGYFRLYQTDGIFQNQAEIDAYVDKDGNKIQPKAVPGDFKWKDNNNDGKITDEDRTDCGNPWAKWSYGISLSADWKGLDFSMLINGKAGLHTYAAQYRKEGYGRMNLPTFYLDRWQKEGDDNGVPRFSSLDPNGNFDKPSDFYLFDTSYLKIGSMELGYSFPRSLISKVLLTKARIYVAADNLATFSAYPFMDPEIGDMRGGGSNVLETGMDYSAYPLARTLRCGVSLSF